MANWEELFERAVLDKDGPIKQCEGFEGPCDEKSKLVIQQACQTQYADQELNHSPFLCPHCADAYHEYWDEYH